MKKSIVWLASYPKSGNTWTRLFLANYLFNTKAPLSINEVHRLGMGDAVGTAYQKVLGKKLPPGDWGYSLSSRVRVLNAVVANKADINFVKTHNFNDNVFGFRLIPEQLTRSAVYIIRNPLDMVISYAKHFGVSVEQAAEQIGTPGNASPGDEGTTEQFFGTWSQHVTSWTMKQDYPVCVLQYENMLEDPHSEFRKVLELIGVPVDEARLDRAIRFSSFDEASKQEAEKGFIERSDKTDKFFGRGQSGHWRDELSQEVVKRIRTDHKTIMKKYGYW